MHFTIFGFLKCCTCSHLLNQTDFVFWMLVQFIILVAILLTFCCSQVDNDYIQNIKRPRRDCCRVGQVIKPVKTFTIHLLHVKHIAGP